MFKSTVASDLLAESRTLAVCFARWGLNTLGRSTLTELTNAVSVSTREALLDAEIRMVTREALDDFSTMILDSTSVAGNTEWPTDSRLTVKLLGRILHVGRSLPKFGLPELVSYEAARIHERLVKIDRDIDMMKRGKNLARRRGRRYKKVIGTGRAAHRSITNELPPIRRALAAMRAPPSRRLHAERVVEQIESDLVDLARVLGHCEARIVDKAKVPAAEKVVSTSDPDAAFIVKGQRDPAVGYKPQLARSGNGFVTGLIVPRGNAADSEMLMPMYEQVHKRTKVTPDRVIVDDGYSRSASAVEKRARAVTPTATACAPKVRLHRSPRSRAARRGRCDHSRRSAAWSASSSSRRAFRARSTRPSPSAASARATSLATLLHDDRARPISTAIPSPATSSPTACFADESALDRSGPPSTDTSCAAFDSRRLHRVSD